jgi:hypothetical protein
MTDATGESRPVDKHDRCRACGDFWPCAGAEFDPSHTATPKVSYGLYLDGRNGGGYVVTETSIEIVARVGSYQEAEVERARLTALFGRSRSDNAYRADQFGSQREVTDG